MLLSVIVPVYNVEQYLNRCVYSILLQTYKELEIILIDDGSTDGSSKMCDCWAQKDARIKAVHKINGGLSSARNAGLDIAKGEAISFVDSDDFIEPDMYQTMLDAMEDSGMDIACCGRIVDLWGEREKREFSISKPQIYSRKDAMKEVLCRHDIDVSAWDKVYRKHLFDGICYPEGKINEDAAIIFQLLERANGVIHVGRDFYHYIFRKNSITKAIYSHIKYDAYENCKCISAYFEQNYPEMMNYVFIYNTQICANLMECMYLNPDSIKEYVSDFEAYKKMFNAGFPYVMKQSRLSLKLKVRLFFIWIGRVDWFVMLKKIWKNNLDIM